MRNQLIAQYMQDSDARGYGIYLVLWFGPEKCQPGVDGRPKSADELEKRVGEHALTRRSARGLCLRN